ncbi:AsnC family protein [Kitasatospora sp. NPDC001603]|uniref:AsnC family protein n=1 Tax=Kitasatospora sp. NPDC001603 TaxID=3154388 RepID=UPI0033198B17
MTTTANPAPATRRATFTPAFAPTRYRLVTETVTALARTLATDEDSLAWALLLCRPDTEADIARTHNVPTDAVRRAARGLAQRSGCATRAHVCAAYYLGGLIGPLAPTGPLTGVRDLTWTDQVLLRLTARLTTPEIAAELAVTPDTARRRVARLLAALQTNATHLAVLGAAAVGLVRPFDVRPDVVLPEPAVDDRLRPAADALGAALATAPHRVVGQIPRPEQAQASVAAALALLGLRSRVLVVAPHGPAWDTALTVWQSARADAGHVAGVLVPGQLAHHTALSENRPVATSARHLLDLAGTRLPVTVVTTPEALTTVAAMHRLGPVAGWDLIVTLDPHPAGTEPSLPAAAHLTLASTSIPTSTTVPSVSATALAVHCGTSDAGRDGRLRGFRLLATAPPPSAPTGRGATADLALLLHDITRRHGLRRVQVACSSALQSRQLTAALDRSTATIPDGQHPRSLWTKTLTPHTAPSQRHIALTHFADGGETLRVLLTHGPVRATGADALLLLDQPDARAAAEIIEWALDPRGRATGLPLLVVAALAPDRPAPGSSTPDPVSVLTRAAALLDPGLAERAAAHPIGSVRPWLETDLHLSERHHEQIAAATNALVGAGEWE